MPRPRDSIRVVVCDDSPFMCRMLVQALDRAGDVEVVGTAATGDEAIRLCRTLHPDVLTLDLQLPGIGGMDVLRQVRGLRVRVLVVSMFATEPESRLAVEALAEGAVDCLGKPSLSSEPSTFYAELLVRVRDIAEGADYLPFSGAMSTMSAGAIAADRLLVIGASTGGPRALHTLLPALPKDLPSPIVVVQHIPANFSNHFVRRLDDTCAIEVRPATEGARLEPGVALVAVAGTHLHVTRDRVQIRSGPRVNGLIPSIDVTMLDAASSWGSRVTGVVLTGIGRDGREGARAIRTAGGRVLAEHQDTCAVYGMPRSVVEAGLANDVVRLDELAGRLVDEATTPAPLVPRRVSRRRGGAAA